MYRTLATIAGCDGVEYPVFLEKRERPDYELQCNNVKFGCEITTAINPDYLRANSLPEASDEGVIVDSSLFKWGTPVRKLEELRNIASRKKLSGPPWVGNSVEREYAKIVKDVTLIKTKKMHKEGYSIFLNNALIIYVNQTLPILDTEEAAEICFNELTNYWCGNSFSHIYVEKGDYIVRYQSSGYKIMNVNNLWKS